LLVTPVVTGVFLILCTPRKAKSQVHG
jgi:hypothetical protein